MLQKLKWLIGKAWSLLKFLVKKVLYWTACLVLILAGAYVVMNAHQLKRNYIRNTVGPNVVKIVKTDDAGKVLGGGTGFMVKAPSGQKYLLTNAHVCEMMKGKPDINVQLQNGNIITRRIIEISNKTDLCLIEPLPNHDNLDLALWANIGETLTVVGHPALMPLTLEEGELIGSQEVEILEGIIGLDRQMAGDMYMESEAECQKPKNKIKEIDTAWLGKLKLCLTVIQAHKVTAPVLGGNSGSPVVNQWGNVVGVLFASPGPMGNNWGLMITLSDIRNFLAAY